jgi:predicted alpha-1,2-mannosidase
MKMKYILYLIFQLILLLNAKPLMSQNNGHNNEQQGLVDYVNPLIGTQNMGHTFPGATTPFGMVQLSPDTNMEPFLKGGKYNPETYRYCAGYQYDDNTIFGFSHTHFSGTGHSDLGDFLIMPTMGALQLEPGTRENPENGYVSTFSHDNEIAAPGYYSVELDEHHIRAELTASDRVGFHRYTFDQKGEAHIILDLIAGIYNYDAKNIWTFVRVENEFLVTGYKQTNGWARTRKVYFAMQFSIPIKNYGHKKYGDIPYNGFYRKFDEELNFPEMAAAKIRAFFDFDMEAGEQLLIKFALSPTSTAGALKNLRTEIPGWNFDEIRQETRNKWESELSKIKIETDDPSVYETFYTAMYHTMLGPVIYEDVDGKYIGLDQNIYESKDFTNYTIFSLWDTYRALHPLFNLLHPDKNNDMIRSMLAHQQQSVHNMLPIWSHYANENWCMIGYHAVSAIADAMVKGTTNIDPALALKACVETANVPYFDGLDHYINEGYVAEDLSPNSVSKTLEYAYDDWCIAQIAAIAGNRSVYKEYMERSENFRNVYNMESGYMQPKLSDGSWRKHFDPQDTHGQGFIEGNAWNYGLYVPHAIDEMISMMGGKEKFSEHLDMIFNTPIDEEYISKNEDITRDGIIGNYVHGNEPGHHIPYLYNWTGHPWKTQERIRMILNTMYGPGPAGLCGNDDVGQMSAWYLFSALGFYPVLPGSDQYAIGSPIVRNATIDLPNGKSLSIIAKDQGPEAFYVKKITLNDEEILNYTLSHKQLLQGGKLVFYMSENTGNIKL